LLSKKPKGMLKGYHWSEIAKIFIPSGEEKTLAEMDELERKRISEKYHLNSYARQFAQWLSLQRSDF
jgi:inosine/xanthosine triphosphate pyrophosphatase family protein